MNYSAIKKEHILFILFFCCLIARQQTRTKSTIASNTYYDATPTDALGDYYVAADDNENAWKIIQKHCY
jgi:hypothetical protein